MGIKKLQEKDLDFVVDTAAPGFKDKEQLKELLLADEAFRKGLIGSKRVFNRVIKDEDIMLRISPRLFFEVLLRRFQLDLEGADSKEEMPGPRDNNNGEGKVLIFLQKVGVMHYLAEMLASLRNDPRFRMRIRLRADVWWYVRFSCLDVHMLKKRCQTQTEADNYEVYKQIANVCLFMTAVFPEYKKGRYPFLQGEKRRAKIRRGSIDYSDEGRAYFKKAAEHEKALLSGESLIMQELHEDFDLAGAVLQILTTDYLTGRREDVFNIKKP